MSFQVPIHQLGQTRLYDVNRDIAHCAPSLLAAAGDLLDTNRWPAKTAAELAARDGAGLPDLMAAYGGLCRFLRLEDHRVTPDEDAHRAGLFGVPPAAQVAVLATFGAVCMAAAWAGRREAVMARDGEASRTSDQQVARALKVLERLLRVRSDAARPGGVA